MQVNVRLIGAFRIDRFKEKIEKYPAEASVKEIVSLLLIPNLALGIILINGNHAKIDDILSDGDTLSLLPILGGG